MEFVELGKFSRRRAVTRHFCNLGLWLPKINLAMLMWLRYEGSAGGEIKYSTNLLDRFVLACKFASEEYKYPPLNCNRNIARAVFRELVSTGLIHKVAAKKYQINKSLIE